MTRDEIKNTPELVDYLLDESVIADSRKKLHKRMDEICNLAIKALEQEPTLSIDDVMSVFDDFMCGEVDEDGTETFLEMLKDKAESEDNK